MFNDAQKQQLQAKLDPSHIKPAKQYGPKGDYIEGWHAMAEANRIFGFDGWSYHITECTCVAQGPREIGRDKKAGFGVTYTSKVRVEVAGVIREDFGAGHGYDVDLGLAHESAIKEAVTDAMKRALRSFGNAFGLALYDKTRENVGYDEPVKEEPKFDQVKADETYKALIADMKRCDLPQDMDSWWTDAECKSLRRWLSDQQFADLKTVFAEQKQTLVAKVAADKKQMEGAD